LRYFGGASEKVNFLLSACTKIPQYPKELSRCSGLQR